MAKRKRTVVYQYGSSHISGGSKGRSIAHDRYGYRMWPISRDPEGVPLGVLKGVSLGVLMRNRKLGNIRPSGAIWPEMTSSNVTNRPSPGTGSHVSALWVLSRTSASYLSFSSPFTGYLALSHHKGSAFNNYTTKVCCFRICSVLLQVVYHVCVLTVGVLNNLGVKWMKW